MSWSHNYLDLDPTYKDDFGALLLRVTNNRNIAKFGIEKCRKIMEVMGADVIGDDEVPERIMHLLEIRMDKLAIIW